MSHIRFSFGFFLQVHGSLFPGFFVFGTRGKDFFFLCVCFSDLTRFGGGFVVFIGME